MKLEDYERFYKNVISKYIAELQQFDSEYGSLKLNKKAPNRIYNFYEKKRIEIRQRVMLDENKPIDRHKTAATMLYAILRADVFHIRFSKPNLPEPLRIANEYLAFHVALNIIELYKRHDELLKNGIKDSKYLLHIPETMYENQVNKYTNVKGSSFISSCCLSLAKIRKIKYFDVLAYSTILFLLENGTDTQIEYEKKSGNGSTT